MNFLKKLFGSNKDLSTPAAPADFTPRADRIRLVALHNIQFRCKAPKLAESVGLSNISTTGAGFLRKASAQWPAIGEVLEGDLILESVPYPIKAKIVRLTDDVVGCTWIDPDPSFLVLIKRYFEAELAAIKLFEVDPRFLKSPTDVAGKPRWIQGDNNCEMYFVKDSEHIPYFNMLVLGNYVEGGEGKPTRFGTLKNLDRDKPIVTASETVEWTDAVSSDLRESILRFLSNVSGLQAGEREKISALIKKIS